MKKENFITLIFGILGGMLFGLGMCMLQEWGLFREGILMGTAGLWISKTKQTISPELSFPLKRRKTKKEARNAVVPRLFSYMEIF